jgi:NADH dehydrogenase FAD-containing subunit
VWAPVGKALDAAAAVAGPERQRRLATVVVGGGGATGVKLASELAEILPAVASGHGLAPDRPAVQLIEAGPTRCRPLAPAPDAALKKADHNSCAFKLASPKTA